MRVSISVQEAEGGIGVQIYDDGLGFETAPASSPGHLGLIAMRERIQAAEGRFKIRSKPGQGTSVQLWVPLQ